MENNKREFERVNGIANDENHKYADGMTQEASIQACGQIFEKYVKGNVLELGPAEGVMTDYFLKNTKFQEKGGGEKTSMQAILIRW